MWRDDLSDMLRLRQLVLISSSALLISLAFHPLKLSMLAWFGLIPLFYAIEQTKPSTHFVSGVLFGFLFSLFSLFWIVFLQIETTVKILMIAGMFILFAFIGLYFGVSLLITSQLGIWFLPFTIAGLEFLRGIGELGFPWLSLGYTQARYPVIIQQASIYGIYGISFWLVLVNVALYKLITLKTKKHALVALCIFMLPILYGAIHMQTPAGKIISVGIIQPNIDPNLKFDRTMREVTFNRLVSLSTACAQEARENNGPPLDLIVWPETATPVFLQSPGRYQDRVRDLAHDLHVPILSGTPIIDRAQYAIYNGAVLIEPDREIEQEYKKIRLVPFGEHIPFDRHIPLFRKIDFGEGDYTPGTDYTVFKTNACTFSCLICFESIFPDLSRTFVQRGASLLVNITNDGWFGKISGPQQHSDMAILRTVENGVPLARSANTGISMAVDRHGRILKETHLFTEDYIVCHLSVEQGSTFFRIGGYLFPLLSLLVVTGLLIRTFIIRYRV
jgi:apolipoprotein N-acyltransferase